MDTPHLWVAYDTVMQAQAFATDAVAQDGRFLAFAHDGSAAARQLLWQRLAAQPGVSAFYDAYPDAAFQEKLSAAACQSEEVKDVA